MTYSPGRSWYPLLPRSSLRLPGVDYLLAFHVSAALGHYLVFKVDGSHTGLFLFPYGTPH